MFQFQYYLLNRSQSTKLGYRLYLSQHTWFPVEVVLVPIWFGYVLCVIFEHLGLSRDPGGSLPRSMALLLVEVRGYFTPTPASPPYPFYLPGCPPQLVSSPVTAVVPATVELEQTWLWPIRSCILIALPTEMSMASLSAYSKENV